MQYINDSFLNHHAYSGVLRIMQALGEQHVELEKIKSRVDLRMTLSVSDGGARVAHFTLNLLAWILFRTEQ